MSQPLLQTTLPFPKTCGKVRDVYDLGSELLIVATDRISAFDCVMPNGIPDKGKILTALSLFWFSRLHKAGVPTHLITADLAQYPSELHPYADQIEGRSMLVKKARVIPIECVARGYLAGSAWSEYQQTQSVCGVRLPPGLKQCDKLAEEIFTPATKEASGHDVNITFEQMAQQLGFATADFLRTSTLLIYNQLANYARSRGILIADTKFEFGKLPDGSIILIDEVLTPDSSRFWPAETYEPGHDQESFDKQFVRNYLNRLNWNKHPPAPALPDEVVEGTRRRYIEAYERLTGQPRRW